MHLKATHLSFAKAPTPMPKSAPVSFGMHPANDWFPKYPMQQPLRPKGLWNWVKDTVSTILLYLLIAPHNIARGKFNPRTWSK